MVYSSAFQNQDIPDKDIGNDKDVKKGTLNFNEENGSKKRYKIQNFTRDFALLKQGWCPTTRDWPVLLKRFILQDITLCVDEMIDSVQNRRNRAMFESI